MTTVWDSLTHVRVSWLKEDGKGGTNTEMAANVFVPPQYSFVPPLVSMIFADLANETSIEFAFETSTSTLNCLLNITVTSGPVSGPVQTYQSKMDLEQKWNAWTKANQTCTTCMWTTQQCEWRLTEMQTMEWVCSDCHDNHVQEIGIAKLVPFVASQRHHSEPLLNSLNSTNTESNAKSNAKSNAQMELKPIISSDNVGAKSSAPPLVANAGTFGSNPKRQCISQTDWCQPFPFLDAPDRTQSLYEIYDEPQTSKQSDSDESRFSDDGFSDGNGYDTPRNDRYEIPRNESLYHESSHSDSDNEQVGKKRKRMMYDFSADL